ncbi:cupin domain-containing protein [Parafilimonas terrae]|uniref:Cupin domain-containing protein n=1 Tax=Parafilimonas terrae TaxID=1465490 RepID=A0A1I5R567_9BACT|nr:cupin domain-containing protein [Parafilimonas terrae]SFP53643.1 hypothetical protein SAMN05444277_10180 [Parafilimonas terrae]
MKRNSFKNAIKKVLQLTIAVVLLFCTLIASAQQKDGQLRLTKQDIMNLKSNDPKAPGSSNLSAVQEFVIASDPSKAAFYTIIIKVAPHTKIPAHLHPDERMATVISGTWYFGYGDKFDESKLKELPAGSIYSEVKNQNHFAMTGDEPVIVAITGYGPSGVAYVNPDDDPLKHK